MSLPFMKLEMSPFNCVFFVFCLVGNFAMLLPFAFFGGGVSFQGGVPAFTVPQPEEAMCVLEETASKLNVYGAL